MVVIQTVYSGNSDREICSGFFSSRGTPLLCQSAGISASEAFFEIKLNCFLDTLLLKIFFFMIKINNFRGDLSDRSAKTATLPVTAGALKPLNNPSVVHTNSECIVDFCFKIEIKCYFGHFPPPDFFFNIMKKNFFFGVT